MMKMKYTKQLGTTGWFSVREDHIESDRRNGDREKPGPILPLVVVQGHV